MSLKGRLLVALPALRDPNFERTVVYVLEHNDEGALGVVLNRTHPMPVRELFPAWAELCDDGHLLIGGPVAHDSAICLVRLRERGDPGDAVATVVADDVGSDDLAADPALLAPHVSAARIFIGYAGWGAQQLEDELGENAWIVCDALPSDVFANDPDDLWTTVLKRQPGRTSLLAMFPPDPRMN